MMKKFQAIILITGILVAGLAFSAVAQKRADKTSSAKAYYGYRSDKPNKYAKKTKKHKYSVKKSVRNRVRAQVRSSEGYIKEFV